jgi:N-acetylmuramoyl-L-alanine amidase
MSHLRRTFAALATALVIALTMGATARPCWAQGAAEPASEIAQLKGMRTWPSPSGTRIVFEISAEVVPVAPDSGSGPQLVVAVPVPGIRAAAGVPSALAVNDSAVTRVETIFDAAGVRFWVRLAAGATFKVYTLPAGEDEGFRVVVEVSRPGAQAAEDRRLASIAAAKKKSRTRLVVIDAGHGGEDVGARGPGPTYEKNVTLQIAKRLADSLNSIPGMRAMLTRDRDFFIPLHDRYKIAEKVKADLFISIHCNSSRRRGRGSGTEVYFLSLKGATDQADQDLTDVENAADMVGGVAPQAEDAMVNVLYEVRRSSMLERSQLLAETLLDHMAADRRVEARGIKQAGFAVLKSVEFPSALVETAFINNPREVQLLKNPAFQQRMAGQLATGIRAYFVKAGVTLTPGDTDSATGELAPLAASPCGSSASAPGKFRGSPSAVRTLCTAAQPLAGQSIEAAPGPPALRSLGAQLDFALYEIGSGRPPPTFHPQSLCGDLRFVDRSTGRLRGADHPSPVRHPDAGEGLRRGAFDPGASRGPREPWMAERPERRATEGQDAPRERPSIESPPPKRPSRTVGGSGGSSNARAAR